MKVFFSSTFWLMYMFSIYSLVLIFQGGHFMGIWLGLIINALSFCGIMSFSSCTINTSSALKYFFVSALSSIIFLGGYLMSLVSWGGSYNFVMISLFIKMGVAPFHLWLPSVSEGLLYSSLFMLLTWQKLGPMFLMMHQLEWSFFFNVLIISSVVGVIGAFFQANLKRFLAYSSVSHSTWLMLAISNSGVYGMFYLLLYSLMLASVMVPWSYMSCLSFQSLSLHPLYGGNLMLFGLLSMGGLPPLLGIFMKLVVMQLFVYSEQWILLSVILLLSILALYLYIRVWLLVEGTYKLITFCYISGWMSSVMPLMFFSIFFPFML